MDMYNFSRDGQILPTWSGLYRFALWCWCKDRWCLRTDRALLRHTGARRCETETLPAPPSQPRSSAQSPPPATSGGAEGDLFESVPKMIKMDKQVDEERVTDPSEFIIVGVDIMKTFNYMSRGPQDPTRVDWVKQLHGDLSARHQLHINTHHWLVYKKNTHRSPKHSTEIWLPILSSRWDQFHTISDEKASWGDMTYREAPRLRPSALWTGWIPHQGLWRNTAHPQGDTKHSHMIEFSEIHYQNRQPVNVVFHELEKQHIFFSRGQLHCNLRLVWWVLPVQTSHCCKGKMSGQSCKTEQRASPAWTWNQHRY